MKKFAEPHLQQQEKVNTYFQSCSSYWKEIYSSGGLQGEIYRNRHTTALSWVESLGLLPGSRVLEIGCGAGLMAVALAQRGFHVHAIDSSEAMIRLARQRAQEVGYADQLSLDIGDIYSLTFEDGAFDLVMAVGVIPWLKRPELAIREMARVTRAGGYALLTADNRARLNYLLDPSLHPALVPLKQRLKATIVRMGLRRWLPDDPGVTLHGCRFIDEALRSAGLVKIRGMTLGFGPFSFLRCKILSESLGIALYYQLQRLADRGVPGLRFTGAHYLVLASKVGAPSS